MTAITQTVVVSDDFEPKYARRWLLECSGIDAFLVRKVILPKWAAVSGEPVMLTPLKIEFIDSFNPNSAQKVMTACQRSSKTPLTLDIKLLKSNGQIGGGWKLSGVVVQEVDFGNLDYEDSAPVVITATFSVKDMTPV